MSVLEQVVEKNWCVGCGMCAAACPKHRLAIRWNERGEYNPVVVADAPECGVNCSVCYDVCPAHGNTKNETEIGASLYGATEEIEHRDETGYYLNSYVGYSEEHRLTSASGGLATWTLEQLLTSGEVDGVAAVGRTADPEKLFEFKICRTVDEIRACSRSAYYPVEASQVIRYMQENEGNYAIIGLPCVCKAVRLAQDKFPRLKTRIKYVLGLTCGHTCSKFFAEYICALGGGDPTQLKEFIFRTKDLSQPASNHGMTFRSGEGKSEVKKQVMWQDGCNTAFARGYFQLLGCFHCDDVFAECADAVFMDAWLPEYIPEPKGTSLVLNRCFKLGPIFVASDTVFAIASARVIASQRQVVKRKRARSLYSGIPRRRKWKIFSFVVDRMIKRQMYWISEKSSGCWTKNLPEFYAVMKPHQNRLDRLYGMRSFILSPLRLVRSLFKKIRK